MDLLLQPSSVWERTPTIDPSLIQFEPNVIFYISKSNNKINKVIIIAYLILQSFTTISEVSGIRKYDEIFLSGEQFNFMV